MPKTPEPNCLTIREAAEQGRVTPQAIRAAIAHGKLEKGPRVTRRYTQVTVTETDTVTEQSFRRWLTERSA